MDPSDEEIAAAPRPVQVSRKSAGLARPIPFSAEAENHVLACCFIDAQTLDRCAEQGIGPSAFYLPENRALYQVMAGMDRSVVGLDTVAQELIDRKLLDQVGGMEYLMALTRDVPTTAHLGFFLERVKKDSYKREVIRQSEALIEHASNGAEVDELIAHIEQLGKSDTPTTKLSQKGLFNFGVPKDGDESILLGDRYLNRGDAAVLVSTSGMGKSSMNLQMAAEYALNRGPFGIKGNGSLRSLIIQSEDSDGDIAEVAASIRHVLKLTPDEVNLVNDKVKIVTDRIYRGPKFIESLKRQIAIHKPDLVWINPLQAFMDGNVTDSQDLGKFLREGLNSLNHPPQFAYVVIHHTTKPSTGKDRGERLWHEVMYDMAGGAEIINWARAILSLRAATNEGEYNLVLAKRGRRAGVHKLAEKEGQFVEEIVTTIPLKHATGRITVEGVKRGIPVIFWEGREPDEPMEGDKKKRGRQEKYPFSLYQDQIPSHTDKPLPLTELARACSTTLEIKANQLFNVLQRYIEDGLVEVVFDKCRKYRKAKPIDYSSPIIKD